MESGTPNPGFRYASSGLLAKLAMLPGKEFVARQSDVRLLAAAYGEALAWLELGFSALVEAVGDFEEKFHFYDIL